MKEIIALDFDGVIHSYISGWKGVDCIPDPPVPYAEEAINILRDKGYEVVVWSTRCSEPDGICAIRNWLKEWHITVDKVVMTKPPCVWYIDDRAITFKGDWRQTLVDILKFRSYLD